jgi:indolepyruvate ferredoxin oxidoreductase, alpha subunit
MPRQVLLGDEAVAQAAIDAGISAAYGYPGTPSTEIMEYLIEKAGAVGGFKASWCSNEKTAMESALGASFANRRSIVTMKHVGLNVAADPFINAAVIRLQGGLVVAVADDPGMHSSQDEQDSRFYADFAMLPCLEPSSQQEAYDMALAAFEASERFGTPVLLRLVTRLSHSRAVVETRGVRAPERALGKPVDKGDWMLLPAHARRNYARLCSIQPEIEAWSETSPFNAADAAAKAGTGRAPLAVITSGLGRNYYDENSGDLPAALPRVHVGAYPPPWAKIRGLLEGSDEVLVIEEGQPFIERAIRGAWRDAAGVQASAKGAAGSPRVRGKLDGTLPRTGELDPDNVRAALSLPPRAAASAALPPLPPRPPQLCQGCPHGDSYAALREALSGLEPNSITADIGCYSLGALKPYDAIESIVCMGASIGMARGASDSGIPYAVAVIGDSTFFHSGITPLVDAVAAKAPITVLILDNSIVAMTGCQPTIGTSAGLEAVISGAGIDPLHLRVLDAQKNRHEENVAVLREEILHRGPSVVIMRRVCLEAFRRQRSADKAASAAGGEGAA